MYNFKTDKMENYTQLCVWPGTELGDSNVKELEDFFKKRVSKIKMVNIRSKLNQFVFHLSNPVMMLFRNFFLKKLVKNKKFLESYLGKIYR